MTMHLIYTRSPIFYLSLVCLLIFIAGFGLGRFGEVQPVLGPLAKEMPIFYIKKTTPQVCLTFDISWGEKTLPLVLQVLREHQINATFFLSGPWAVRHSEQIKSIRLNGHEIASHGDRHINLSQFPKEVVRENIAKAHQDLLTVTDKVAPFFRPPNGDYDDLVVDTARELGYETVIWSVDSLDWKNPGPEYMVHRVLQRTFPGAIILCHASDSSREIHLALPEIIRGLKAKGFQFVTLSELGKNGECGRNDPR